MYNQMITLNYQALRGATQIAPLGDENAVRRIGSPGTIADAVALDEKIAQANAVAAAFIQKLEAIRDGDVLDVAPDELREENFAIKKEAVAVIEKRIEIRKQLQAEFADYKAARKAELVAAQNAAVPHVEALIPYPSPAGEARRDALVAGAVTKEFAAYQWEPANLFRHHDERDLTLAKRGLGIALLDAAGLSGAVALPAQVVLPV